MAQQFPDLFKTIAESNQRLWDEWSKAFQSTGGRSGVPDVDAMFKQNLDLAEKMVKDALSAEAKWMDQWYDSLENSGRTPAEFKDFIENVRKTTKTMLESRARMWESWLDQARNLKVQDLGAMTNTQEAQKAFTRLWEDFAKQAEAAQERLLSSFDTGSAKASTSKSGARKS